MTSRQPSSTALSRRDFIKSGLFFACAVCMAKIPGNKGVSYADSPEKGFMRPRPSPWFSPGSGKTLVCMLCPKGCRMAPGQRGKCGVRENRDGTGYTLAYGNPALVRMDPVERLPFFHMKPGARTLSVSTAGCPLECAFCEVWDMALAAPEEVHAYDLSPEEIIRHARSSDAEAVSFAFGEPIVFYEYMSEIAAMAKKEGLLNLVHTSGYISPEPLLAILGNIDAVNIDLKGFDSEFYRKMTGGDIEPVKKALNILRRAGVHIEITNLLIPGKNDDMDQVKNMCTWIKNALGADTPVHLARFYPLYKLANLPQTPVSTLDRARDTAMEAGLAFVYIARVTGHEAENTFCPECGKIIIDRMGFVIEAIHIANGECAFCAAPVSGKWT